MKITHTNNIDTSVQSLSLPRTIDQRITLKQPGFLQGSDQIIFKSILNGSERKEKSHEFSVFFRIRSVFVDVSLLSNKIILPLNMNLVEINFIIFVEISIREPVKRTVLKKLFKSPLSFSLVCH